MRYGALAFYSAVLQAVGLVLALASLALGIGAAVYVARHFAPTDRPLAWLVCFGAAATGLLIGIIIAALGQFFAVVMDIEANTHRPAPPLEWGD